MSDNIVNRYGALWDGENPTCTRMYNAVGKVAAAHMGTFDAGLINDFDSIYPWSGMRLCNWTPGTATEKAKITAFEGEPGYDATANLGVYRPEFWYSIEPQADGGILFVVADGKLPGYHYSPPYMLTAFCVADDGNGGLQCKPGDVQYNGISLNSYNSKNAAQGMLTEDYLADGAEKLLLTVEFANLNSQAATGNGFVFARYNDDRPAFAELATNRVILTKAAADAYIPEKQTVGIGLMWFGRFKAQHRKIVSVTPYENDAAYSCVNFDGDAVDVETTDHVGSMSAIFDGAPVGHGSGYVGADGKAISYYRGAALQTGAWMWVASIMRSSAEEIWVAPTDNPQTGKIGTDWVNTGLTLPSAEGYIKHIAVSKKNPIVMQPDAVGDGANSVMPVGDYLYRPAVGTGATAPLSRGHPGIGSRAGAWFDAWWSAPSGETWDRAARSLIRNPFNTVMPLPPTTETVPISEPITNAAGIVTLSAENTLQVTVGVMSEEVSPPTPLSEPMVNGKLFSAYGGAMLFDYTVGGTEIANDYFKGRNRSSWNQLSTVFGMRSINLSILFTGPDLNRVTLQKSQFDAACFGQIELFLPDGFFYTANTVSVGDSSIVGIGETQTAIKADYSFEGIRHSPLVTATLSAGGGTVYCQSTLPFTDCILSCTVTAPATSYVLGGATFKNVQAGETLVFDGINKRILRGGAPGANNVNWTVFPQLIPGANNLTCVDAVTVQYYPVYM